jgi:AcrR family transcriptional regulator
VSSPDGVLDASQRLGRRERKKIQTKERIVECAVALFASRGYDSTTMEDIGECADVSRATVFNYFTRKDEIVSEVFRRRRAELAELLAEANEQASDTRRRLQRALTALARLHEDDPAARRATVRAWLRAGGPLMPDASDTAALFADVVRSGQQRGDVPHNIKATSAGLVILDTYLGVLYRWVSHEDDEFDLEENLMAALDVVLTGITRDTPAV